MQCGYRAESDDYDNRNYLENFVLKTLGDKIFTDERLENILKIYRKTDYGQISETGLKLDALNVNLNSVNQKIDNLVQAIENSYNELLVKVLEKNQAEKNKLLHCISATKELAESSAPTENEIREAFYDSKKCFYDGTLPECKQIINLFLKRVVVFPEHVEIEVNNL